MIFRDRGFYRICLACVTQNIYMGPWNGDIDLVRVLVFRFTKFYCDIAIITHEVNKCCYK